MWVSQNIPASCEKKNPRNGHARVSVVIVFIYNDTHWHLQMTELNMLSECIHMCT